MIKIENVNKIYDTGKVQVEALKNINLNISSGELAAIIGPSGSGKSTLVNMITGLDRSTSGEIWVAGTPVHRLGAEKAAGWRGQNLGVVFQAFELLPTLTVLQNVTLPMDFAGKYSIRQRRKRAMT